MRSSLRPWRVLLVVPIVLALLGTVGVSGCGTEPVNPDGCEKIELARCEAAPACEAFSADFDVDACKRFYRDQCLKGLQTENDPGDPKIDACVRAIEKAGACARDGTAPCDVGTREIDAPCNLIVAPEQFDECGFLDDGYEEDAGLSPFPEGGAEASSEASTNAQADGQADGQKDGAGG